MSLESVMRFEADKNSVKRRSGWLLLAVLLGLSRPAMAEQGPVEVLQAMTDTLLDIVRQDPDVIHDEVRLRVIANDTLSRWVLGRYWRTASPQQRAAFIAEFREMILRSYLRSVSAYRDNGVRFLPLRGDLEKGLAVVNAEIDQPDGPVAHVMFRMRLVTEEWKIYDVAVEGISLVATHRTSFSQQIRSDGMARLHARNVDSASQETAQD
jgi:phospholipid transport system substrate-binding protein